MDAVRVAECDSRFGLPRATQIVRIALKRRIERPRLRPVEVRRADDPTDHFDLDRAAPARSYLRRLLSPSPDLVNGAAGLAASNAERT
jgi:hypothetical protein